MFLYVWASFHWALSTVILSKVFCRYGMGKEVIGDTGKRAKDFFAVIRGSRMTLNGALAQLVEMRDNEMMPTFFRPYFDKVIETVEMDAIPVEWVEDLIRRLRGETAAASRATSTHLEKMLRIWREETCHTMPH